MFWWSRGESGNQGVNDRAAVLGRARICSDFNPLDDAMARLDSLAFLATPCILPSSWNMAGEAEGKHVASR